MDKVTIEETEYYTLSQIDLSVSAKTKKEFRKKFYRMAVKQIAEKIVDNCLIHKSETNIYLDSEDNLYKTNFKIFQKNYKDPRRLPR